jgi:benzoyl-CoA reductase/2-hydroxyglutaryl-CoA dehydratase subunit BcrC/BadD/HgdB
MAEKAEKRTSGKTLQTAREAGYFGKKAIKNAIAAMQEGRPIGWSMVTWYQGELICKAMGIEMLFPENYGAFCAAVRGAEQYLQISDKEGFPTTVCGYARNCFGYVRRMADNNMVPPADAPGGGLAKPTVLVSSNAACDARFKWFQSLARYMDVPIWLLELPHTGVKEFYLPENRDLNIKFMVSELRQFVAFLEKIIGKKMDWARLEEIVDQSLKTLRLANEVDLLRRTVPSPMVSTDFWSIMLAHMYFSDDPEAYAFYRKVYDEVKHRVDNGIPAIPNEKYRMIFSELPPWHTLGFFDIIAEKYGIVMVKESSAYEAPRILGVGEFEGKVTDPLELIACLTYQWFTTYFDTARKYDVGPGYIMTPPLQWAEEYKADGIFCHALMSCRPATYTLLHQRNMMEEKLMVPGVVVDGDIVDERVFNEKEALSKVEAFVETMDYYRERRKAAGMAW